MTYTFFRIRTLIILFRIILSRKLFNASRLSRSVLYLTRYNCSIFKILYTSIMILSINFTQFFALSFIFSIFFNWFFRESFDRIHSFIIFDISSQSIFERATINFYMTMISICTTFIIKRSSTKKKTVSKTRLIKKIQI